MIGAGSTVVHDVPDYALMVGVPARRIGWVGPAGHRLQQATIGIWQCPVTNEKFVEVAPNEIREEIKK
jgi:serine acetyltransferase